MNANTEETLNKAQGLIKDDHERTRRFNHLMDQLNVPRDNGVALHAIEGLSTEQKQQAEQDLVHIFQQMAELNASVDDSNSMTIIKEQGNQPVNKDLKTHKPQRPILMRGLTI